MDKNKTNSHISTVLEEFKDYVAAYEESKRTEKELTDSVALLREELKLARDEEKAADFKRSRTQAFVSQQQEAILKLLNVKEENENLKQKINQLEATLNHIQHSSISESIQQDAEIEEMKQEYLKELIKIQEDADNKMIKMKSEFAKSVDELKSKVTKTTDNIEQQADTLRSLEAELQDLRKRASVSDDNLQKGVETIQQNTNTIYSLEAELRDLKYRTSVDNDVFQKKLAEQEGIHQAELETWKMAEVTQAVYYQSQINRAKNTYQSGQLLRPTQGYQHNKPTTQLSSYCSTPSPAQPLYQSQFLNSCSRPVTPGVPTTAQPPSAAAASDYQKTTDFISANNFYLQNREPIEQMNEENSSEKMNNDSNDKPNKPLVPIKRRKLFNTNQNVL